MNGKIKLDLKYLLIDDNIYGGNQEWYKKYIQRLSGCGPTTASTIIMYEERFKNKIEHYTKEELFVLMEEMWNYITPGRMGVNKVEYYENGFSKYIREKNIELDNCNKLLIEKNKKVSPSELYDYLYSSLNNNHPVAFLNLNNGKENRIESWHWVTIVGISYNENKLFGMVADGGVIKEIDLGLWLDTTTLGGGFIYFE